jgi:methionyl-tRNA formyltransferase
LKIVFAGTTTNAVDVLRYLVQQGRHEIVAVITREDALVGRNRVLTPSPVAAFAEAEGLAVIRANKITPEIDQQIASLDADLGLVIAFGALLRARTLAIAKYGWINIHFSLLPKWRGAAPVQRALMAGERETGVSIFQLDEGMDTGRLHQQVPVSIEPSDNSKTLLERLTRISISMLDETLSLIEAGIAKTTYQIGEPTHAAKLDRSDVQIDWSKSASEIEHLIRGAYPEPVAWTNLNGQPFRILSARQADELSDGFDEASLGQVKLSAGKACVLTGAGLLQLLEVQPASKPAMPATDWLRGKGGTVIFE